MKKYRINSYWSIAGEWMMPTECYYIEVGTYHSFFFGLIHFYTWDYLNDEYDIKYKLGYSDLNKVKKLKEELEK